MDFSILLVQSLTSTAPLLAVILVRLLSLAVSTSYLLLEFAIRNRHGFHNLTNIDVIHRLLCECEPQLLTSHTSGCDGLRPGNACKEEEAR